MEFEWRSAPARMGYFATIIVSADNSAGSVILSYIRSLITAEAYHDQR
jgi:hypothetical protein